ncbi:MAG: hypothetical protein DRH57_09515 [Candidatus Cloacimonadota bacterium]|nr:MAG: hypothetical protein DRH57_09515 [Candidatus Cloacimonadota bacterium]
MSKRKKEEDEHSSLAKVFIKLLFDLLRHLIKDWESRNSTKRFDELTEKYKKLEGEIKNYMKKVSVQVEKLENKMLWSNILTVILLMIVIAEFIMIVVK